MQSLDTLSPLPERGSPSHDAVQVPPWFLGELRSDHAGETGAVMIYRGMCAVTRSEAVKDFALRHLQTEQRHLEIMNDLLPPSGRSLLLPLWRVAGWITGALPALLGPRAAFATVEAVEIFVDRHYQQQIDQLRAAGGQEALLALLEACQADEQEHRDEGAALAGSARPAWLRLWCGLVGAGSAGAVALARRI